MDGKIHQGQLLTNKTISAELKEIFDYVLKLRFPVGQAIPIVKYNWDDNLSMKANNTYSFCYRDLWFFETCQRFGRRYQSFFESCTLEERIFVP